MKIEDIINELFKKVPYSKKYQKIRTNIKASLEKEYKKYIEKNKSHLEAITELLKQYGTLEKAGILAGYTKEEIKTWESKEKITSTKTFKKIFKKERRSIIIFSISLVCFITCVLTSIIYKSLINILFSIFPLFIGIMYLTKIKKQRKIEYNYSFETYFEIQNLEDKYHKKTINSYTFTIALISITIMLILNTHYRYDEIISQIMSSLTIYLVAFICLIKNLLNNRILKDKIESEYEKKYKKQLKAIIGLSLIFWISGIIASIFLYSKLKIIIILILLGIYSFLYIIYLFKFRKKIAHKNININKKRILIITFGFIGITIYQIMKLDSWLLSSNVTFVEAIDIKPPEINYNNETGVYTLTTDKENFKILQLTDIHLGGSNFSYLKDSNAIYDVKELIKYTKPDLVIVTGDLVFPVGIMSMSLNNKTPIIQFAALMRNMGVPWVFAYGNHDTESMAVLNEKEVDSIFKMLSFKSSRNLLYPYTQPDITGRNNQLLEVRNKQGKLLQALFILDSNSYIEGVMNEYDYIHDDQVNWYEEKVKELSKKEGYTIPSMLFFHMPLKEYQEAYNLYKNGNNKVKYYYGEIGEENEKICASKHPSKLFETALQLGSTKAMFCGHDHLNNISLDYQGIRLTYGLSIDYLAYPGIEKLTNQRGGTLITIKKDSTFEIKPIKVKDI